jgi:archaellum component FlaC
MTVYYEAVIGRMQVTIQNLNTRIKALETDVERLTSDNHILVEELEREQRPKQDER